MADWPQRPLQKVDPEGRASRSLWRILAHEGEATRVELAPLTGRTHQLRVHLLALGHPILGDALYGGLDAQTRSPRLLLHASQLQIAHPQSGERCAWESPAPF
jgi:tRNA pseudouridine32 synthase/23S rRNA pseudouridine746 synthase